MHAVRRSIHFGSRVQGSLCSALSGKPWTRLLRCSEPGLHTSNARRITLNDDSSRRKPVAVRTNAQPVTAGRLRSAADRENAR